MPATYAGPHAGTLRVVRYVVRPTAEGTRHVVDPEAGRTWSCRRGRAPLRPEEPGEGPRTRREGRVLRRPAHERQVPRADRVGEAQAGRPRGLRGPGAADHRAGRDHPDRPGGRPPDPVQA